MKYITCFFIANFIHLGFFCCYAAGPCCDPSQPSKAKSDTAAKKNAIKTNTVPPQVQPANKPTAKKEDKKSGGDVISPFSWRPAFIY